MPRQIHRLTALEVQRCKKGKLHDGGGLYVLGDSQSFSFRFKRHGRDRWHGLGPFHAITLTEARERARVCRKMLLDGIDPITAKREQRAALRLQAAKAMSFAQCADAYFEAHHAGWSAKHAQGWRTTLASYAHPILGDLPVAAIDTALVLKALEPIWTKAPDLAGRLRRRIEAVLDFAKARGYRDAGENPGRWHGHLKNLLPAQSRIKRIKHHAALPWRDLPGFMVELRRREGVDARALEFIILTAARLGEAINATWAEIDLAHRTWTIAATRMKGGKEHCVPLSGSACAVLERMQTARRNDLVFPGKRRGRPVGELTVWRLAKDVAGDANMTVHGFRSSFRDWAGERTNYPREVCEMALAHVVGNTVELAYRRGTLFDKRRRLMEEWARYCGGKPAAKADVVALRRG
jgi:integrase